MVCLFSADSAAADEPDAGQPSSPPANKLTLAFYDFSSGKKGFDVNLRHTFKSIRRVQSSRPDDGFLGQLDGVELLHRRQLVILRRTAGIEELET